MTASTDTLTEAYHGVNIPVKRVRVTATVEFDAWVVDYDAWDATDPDEHDSPIDEDALAGRAAAEIADAIEHHAVHLTATDPGDALVALVSGGDGQAVDVTDIVLDDLTDEDDGPGAQGVDDAVARTAAWVS